jgi:hypothetical protein
MGEPGAGGRGVGGIPERRIVVRKIIHLAGACALSTGCLAVMSMQVEAASSTTCDGTLAPGSYGTVVVPAGAACSSDGPVRIAGGLFIEPGATFVLGDESAPGNTGTINGGVHATHPASVRIHFTRINGGLEIHGGSGPFGGPFDITWNAIEDNHINGNVTVDGYDGFWMGFIRNHVNGVVNLNNNVLQDPDGNEYVTNTINGGLNCTGNSPAPQIGDSEGSPNHVNGPKTGQCANL